MSEINAKKKKSIFDILMDFSTPLLAGVVVALIWANMGEHSFHDFLHWSPFGKDHFLHFINFHFLINDIFMVFFFGLATKEIVEATLPGGDLNPVKKAINPIFATLGGVVGPVSVYFAYMYFFNVPDIRNGWAVPTATDIALAWLIARVIFGTGHPAISFLLLLAIVDDGIGLGIIAIFYPNPAHPVEPVFLLLIVGGMILAFVMKKMKMQNFWVYVILAGTASWFGLYLAGLHPALALVFIVPFLPYAKKDEGLFAERLQKVTKTDALNQFEHKLKLPVDIGLFGFGIANAGVVFSSIGHATWAVLLALAIGKTLGVTLFSGAGTLLGFSLPKGMNFRSLIVAAMIAGVGMTVALFVAGVAFPGSASIQIQGAAKMGALLSFGIGIVALIVGRVLKVKQNEVRK